MDRTGIRTIEQLTDIEIIGTLLLALVAGAMVGTFIQIIVERWKK